MKMRICSVVLCLAMLLTSASALTAEQAGQLLQDYYIDEVSEEVLSQDSVDAMLQMLGDPYTRYYTAEEYAAFLASMEDTELVGIGIVAYYLDEGILVNQTAPDSPARQVGIQPGDYIIAVNEQNVCGAAESDINALLKGPEGTSVLLSVRRGQSVFHVTAVRSRVVFPTVELKKIENGVALISCTAFGSTTAQHFYDIITAHDDEVEQWIVDLRGNGGGDVYSALFSAGFFAGNGAGIYLRNGAGRYYGYLYDCDAALATDYCSGDRSEFYADGYLTEDPVYVLTDKSTASASELFCAAIRDAGAGLIVGERTFGKGIAQTMLSGSRYGLLDGDALKITTERGYAKAGGTYDKVGIIPHFLVDAELADEAAMILAAPVAAGEDALLLRDLSQVSQLVDDMILPMGLLRDPANAAAVAGLLSSLPAFAYCQKRVDGMYFNISLEEAAQLCAVSLEKCRFPDTKDSEYATEIETLRVYGVVEGVGDGTFQAGAAMDRATLCALLVKALRLPVSGSESTVFADVSPDAWYAPCVDAVHNMGLVQGYNGYFFPEEPVTHEQFIAILGRTAKWLDMNYHELSLHDGLYGDVMPDAVALGEKYGNYSEWAREQVWLCDSELLWKTLETIDPAAATTRGEAAASVFNLLCESGVLPG